MPLGRAVLVLRLDHHRALREMFFFWNWTREKFEFLFRLAFLRSIEALLTTLFFLLYFSLLVVAVLQSNATRTAEVPKEYREQNETVKEFFICIHVYIFCWSWGRKEKSWERRNWYPRWSSSSFADSLRAHKKSCSSCFWLYALNSVSIPNRASLESHSASLSSFASSSRRP